MHNPANPPEMRFLAAKEAAPYCHAKLSSIEGRQAAGPTHEERLAEFRSMLADEPAPLQLEIPDSDPSR